MKSLKIAAIAATLAAGSQAFAVNGAQLFTPVVNEAGVLTLHSSSYGESSKLGLGLMYNVAVDPREVSDSLGALENYVHSLNFGVGSKLPFEFLKGRVHVFADGSAHYISPMSTALDNQVEVDSEMVLGNVKLGVGHSIIDNSNGGLGVGIVTHAVVPVGGKNSYLDSPRNNSNDRAWQYGATLAVDYRVIHKDLLALNIGWDRRFTDNFLTWGVGYQTPILGGDTHNLLFELRGEQNLEDPKTANSDPVEADLAYKGYCMDRKGSYTVGIGRGMNRDNGAPDLRVFLGTTFQLDHGDHGDHAHHEEAAATPAAPVAEAPKAAPVAEAAAVVAGVSTLKVAKIYFGNNSDAILEKSNAGLDKLAADLNANPGLKKLAIEGFTDNVGNADYNKALSQKRADSVKTYLTGKGVDGNRLTTAGMGPESPIADNATAAGRAANRRVEFRVLEVDGNIKMDLE
jgi:outer membrane protein OmpA-like peptidoglycan-associated protein